MNHVSDSNSPNYVEEGTNAIVVADVSGSMYGRPMASSIGLALYFAERNTRDFHNLFMTFADKSEIVTVKGNTLREKINAAKKEDWGQSTNLRSAFERILNIAVKYNTPSSDMPKSIIVVSDMELIISKDYRKFMEEKNIELSDWDKATLIYNHTAASFPEKIRVLKELCEQTQDEELIKQIKERIAQETKYVKQQRAIIRELSEVLLTM